MNKRKLVELVFAEIGLSNVFRTLTSEQLQQAAIQIEGFLASSEANGYPFGYPFDFQNGAVNLDVELSIPPYSYEFCIAGGAITIAPSYGTEISPQTSQKFTRGQNAILSFKPIKPRRGLNVPAGRGNWSWIPWLQPSQGGNFLPNPVSNPIEDER